MHLKDFDYDLPESLIAQHALPDRASSRLMVVDRSAAVSNGDTSPQGDPAVKHAAFRDLPTYLDENDVLVVNRSRVIPARIFVHRATGGRVELLFIRERRGGEFEAWVRPIGRLRSGEVLRGEADRGGDEYEFVFVEQIEAREGVLRLRSKTAGRVALEDVFEKLGHVPLPPYIRRPDEPEDHARYQTVYAREKGSVAAPTAGLHFDRPLLDAIAERGVTIAQLVLHVGPGTFSPLDEDEVAANRLQSESFEIPVETAAVIRDALAQGRRIVAVGTTVTRALESAHAMGAFNAAPPKRRIAGETDLFIYPGYEFRVVDRLITNFHLPRSSLLLLVCAFLGRERTLACYRTAVRESYRFYSYGDAMLIR
jgi:S-adenosylmethionine:tRNA ribosyltransferase-isomerase